MTLGEKIWSVCFTTALGFLMTVAVMDVRVTHAQTPIGDPRVSCQVSDASPSKPGSPVRSLAGKADAGWSLAKGTRGCARLMDKGFVLVEMPVMTEGGVAIWGVYFLPSELEGGR